MKLKNKKKMNPETGRGQERLFATMNKRPEHNLMITQISPNLDKDVQYSPQTAMVIAMVVEINENATTSTRKDSQTASGEDCLECDIQGELSRGWEPSSLFQTPFC